MSAPVAALADGILAGPALAGPALVGPVRFASVDELLDDARSRLVRLSVLDAAAAVTSGARIVDIRPAWQREVSGEVPGALIVERNHLEWRLHPASDARLPQARPGQVWLVICNEGYTSSLAADALRSLGVPATDIDGGFVAWRAAGLPTVQTLTRPDTLVHWQSTRPGRPNRTGDVEVHGAR